MIVIDANGDEVRIGDEVAAQPNADLVHLDTGTVVAVHPLLGVCVRWETGGDTWLEADAVAVCDA